MYDKILKKLTEQRGKTSNVSDRSLQDLAKSLVSVVTTDEILALADLSGAIASIDGNISHYTKAEIQKMNDNAAKVEAERVAKEAADAAEAKAKKDGTPNIAGEIAAALQTAMKPLMEEISGLKTDKVKTSRTERLNEVLKEAPDTFKTPIMAGLGRMTFDTDEAFEEYVAEVTTSKDAFVQVAREHNLPFTSTPKNTKLPIETGETKELSSARKLVNDAKATKE